MYVCVCMYIYTARVMMIIVGFLAGASSFVVSHLVDDGAGGGRVAHLARFGGADRVTTTKLEAQTR